MHALPFTLRIHWTMDTIVALSYRGKWFVIESGTSIQRTRMRLLVIQLPGHKEIISLLSRCSTSQHRSGGAGDN